MHEPPAAAGDEKGEQRGDGPARGRVGGAAQGMCGRGEREGQDGPDEAGSAGQRGEEPPVRVGPQVLGQHGRLQAEGGELSAAEDRGAGGDQRRAASPHDVGRGRAARHGEQRERHAAERDRERDQNRAAQDTVGEVGEGLHLGVGAALPPGSAAFS